MSLLTPLNRVLLLLVVVQLGWLVAERALREDPYRPPRPVEGNFLFPQAKADEVARLRITAASRTTDLQRRGEGWVVANEGDVVADPYFVDVALRALQGMPPGNLVSENPEQHDAYQVAAPLGVEVEAEDKSGAVVARFVIGRATPNGRSFYVRYPADGADVMMVSPNHRDAFLRYGNRAGAWRERTIFNARARDVLALQIINRSETIVIKRRVPESGVTSDDDDWQVLSPRVGEIDRLTVNAMAQSFAGLTADGVADDDISLSDVGLEPPRVSVMATLADGSELKLEIGDEVDKLLHVRRASELDVFRVHVFQLHNFLRTAEQLIKD